jgi:hypothetical protein
LYDRNDAISCALRALAEGSYRVAARQIHRSERLANTICRLLDASETIDKAVGAIGEIAAMVRPLRLRQLPTIASLESLVGVARNYMRENRYSQASYVATLCRRRARLLASESVPIDRALRLKERRAAIEELCLATSRFTDDQSNDVTVDGTLQTLGQLAHDGRLSLAARLTAELEVVLKSRCRFYKEVKDLGEQLEKQIIGPQEEMAETVRTRSWIGALDVLWQRAVVAHMHTLEISRLRLESVTVDLGKLQKESAVISQDA